MKVKNVTDSFLFPIGNLVGDDAQTVLRLADESDEAYQKRSLDLRGKMAEFSALKAQNAQLKEGDQAKPLDQVAYDALIAQLDPAKVNKYRQYGVDLPSDLVRVNMTLGSLIFDLFTATAEQPKAPLAAALYARKVQNLAGRLQNDEFVVDNDLLLQIRPAIEDESKWGSINLTLFTLVGTRKAYLQVNHNAAGFFGNVMNAAIGLFVVDEQPAATEGTQDAAQAETAAPVQPKLAAVPAPAAQA